MKKNTMGATIAQRRKALGMTQLDLAEKMGVTDKAVSKWERDLSCPDVESLPKLAGLFSMSVDELMQARSGSGAEKKTPGELVNLALKAVAMAMGVAVAVLSILGELEVSTGLGMLGIGLACLAVTQFAGSDGD